MAPVTSEKATPIPGRDPRIAQLVHAIQTAEDELQLLIGDRVDAVTGLDGAPLLLRHAQERLRKSESHLRAIFENEPECVKIVSPDGIVLEMNPAGLRMIDAPDGTRVIGTAVLGLVHPDDRAIFMDLHTRVCGGATGQAQFRIIGFSGTERWMDSHSAPLRANDGSITSVLSVTRDITQSKRAEDVLRASEARFRTLFDQAAVGMCLVSAEGEFLRTNRRFCEIVGYSAEEMLGRTCIETTHPDDRAREAAITTRMLSGELQSSSWDKRYLHRDGRVIWCTLTLTLSPVGGGNEQQFVGVIEDITERRQAAEERDRMFNLSVDLLSVGNFEGGMEQVNPAWTLCLGWSAEELTSRPWLDFVHPDDQEATRAVDARLVRGEQVQDFENRYRCKDGRYRWLSWNAHSMPETRQIFSVCRDVTERRVATERLRHNQAMLNMAGRAARLGGWSIDLPARKLTWSDETAIIHDCEPGHSPSLEEGIDFCAPEYRDAVAEHLRQMMTDGTSWDFQHELITARKRRIWVRSIGEAQRDEKGEIVRVYGAYQDITERKNADLALIASNRALQLLSRCNEALVRSTDEAALLEDICQIAVDVGGFAMAWVGYAQDDADKTIAPQTLAGTDGGYLSRLVLSWSEDHPRGTGPAGHVIRSGEPMVIPDLSQESIFAPWFDAAQAHGFAGVVVLPLKDATRTFGVLVLYAGTVRTPHEDELLVLRELAEDLAFGISNLRAREERRRLETAVAKVAESVSVSVGANFFTTLAVSAAEAMNADGAFVAQRLSGEPATVRTVAAVLDGQVMENFDYVLHGTPCERLTDQDECVVPADAVHHFPDSPRLAVAGAQAYAGRRLVGTDGQFLGVMYVLFRKPLLDSGFVAAALRIFATRAAGEFERLGADTRIQEQAALLEKATDAIIVRDLSHRVVFWNPAAERMFGWSVAEATGRPTPEFLYPDMVPFETAIAALLDRGEWTGELNKKTREHQTITVECRWTLVRDEHGKPRSVLCIETDITERKKLEAQFLRAQRMESVGTMASGIAHDMNNILAPIMMSIELLKVDAKDVESLETLNTLASSSQRGADLVRQLLAFARGIDGEKIVVDLHAMLVDLHKVLKEVFPKNVEFGVSAGRDLWKINGDPSQLHQVFMNLCVNARDAMPNGGKLTVHVENVVLDEVYAAMNPYGRTGAYVVIGVTDSGMGMPSAVLDKIFEPFYTTKEIGKGTGLGLSTVMGIVKNHGGFVHAYSEEGRGSQFKVYLPAYSSEAEREEEVVVRSKNPRGEGQLILLVDDEAGVLDVATRTLVRFGYRVLQASNGAEAVALYVQRQREIALVLTDVSMPIMDGVALVSALRAINPDVRVLISSGLPVNAGVSKLMEWGASRFVPKPYTADTLLRTISEELQPERRVPE